MAWSIMLFLYSMIVTTEWRSRLHCGAYGFCPLNYIHALKKKYTSFSIERNIGKPFQIMGWWTDIDSLINGNIFILECITDNQNHGSESMHSRDRNVDYEGVSMCHWNVGLIKTNTLNLRNPVCTVLCKTFPCIRTDVFLDNWINEWAEKLCSFREGFN